MYQYSLYTIQFVTYTQKRYAILYTIQTAIRLTCEFLQSGYNRLEHQYFRKFISFLADSIHYSAILK